MVYESVQKEVTAAGKIHAFISTRVSYGEANRDFFRIYYTEFSNLLIHPVHVKAEFRDLYERQAQMLQDVLDQGIQNGELRKVNTSALARLIYRTTRGLIAQRLLSESNATSVSENADFLLDVMWKGVGC